MEKLGQALQCAECGNSRRNSENGVYCLKFGIMIHRSHTGCKHHTKGYRHE
jgi:hypothetical protein